MNLLLAGGGTGGHVYPALALAGALRRRDPGARLLFAGSASGMEAALVPAAGVPFAGLTVRPPRSRSPLRAAIAIATGAVALVQAVALVARFRPDAVVATGGIAAAPPVLAAWLARVPVVLLEGNAAPGRANAFLARFARAVAVTSDDAAAHITGGRALVTGLPVRPEVFSTRRSDGLRAFGLDPARRTVLVIGGSQGAARLNAAVDEMAASLAGRADLQILHQTGRGWRGRTEAPAPAAAAAPAGAAGAKGLRHARVPYFDQIGLAYACADLVISRSGATALAEITACGLPAVLVPYRYAAGGHQAANAAPLIRAGAAVLVDDAALDGAALAHAVLEVLDAPRRRDAMADRSRALGRPDAADRVLALVEGVRGGTAAAVSNESHA